MNSQKVHSTYDPGRLLDGVRSKLNLKSDEELAGVLRVSRSVIKNIRYNGSPVDASLLIRIQDVTNFSFNDLRWWMGDRRHKFRFSDKSMKFASDL
jgi:transcriptional regulator with XRE-family HTH domain